MNRIIKRMAMFNSLEPGQLGLETTKALNLINGKDARLTRANVILYFGRFSLFGGIYKETNSTANDNTLFAVEFFAYKVYNKNLDRDMSYAGVIATVIDYLDQNNNPKHPELTDWNYVEIYNSEDTPSNLILSLKDNVTVQGLSLKYVAPNFDEAAQKLHIFD